MRVDDSEIRVYNFFNLKSITDKCLLGTVHYSSTVNYNTFLLNTNEIDSETEDMKN